MRSFSCKFDQSVALVLHGLELDHRLHVQFIHLRQALLVGFESYGKMFVDVLLLFESTHFLQLLLLPRQLNQVLGRIWQVSGQ